jgi:nitrogen regulatory protein P-II 1
MSYLVVLIVDDPDHCPDIMHAWEKIGVPGVTILESSGYGRIRRGGLRENLPIMPSLSEILEGEEIQHRTLLSVVKDQEMVDQMVSIVQDLIGDLDEPNSGFLFVVPVLQAYGLNRRD